MLMNAMNINKIASDKKKQILLLISARDDESQINCLPKESEIALNGVMTYTLMSTIW